VQGIPTCLSPLIRNAREDWGFEGYVTSDSDSIQNAYADHAYPQPNPDAERAVALALTKGQCDINSGDTYNNFLLSAVQGGPTVAPYSVSMTDVDRALFNSLKQRFDLGLFDPEDSYSWPTNDDVGSDASAALSLKASQESIVILRNDDSLLPLPTGKRIAVIGPHANAQEVLVQPYPFSPFCPDNTLDCIVSPAAAISKLNGGAGGQQWTRVATGCDLFANNTANFSEAIALAKDADYVILALGIETCGMTPAHNVNPARPGRCFQEKLTTDYVFPDQYLELEAHDRTIIDLPEIQHRLAAEILALNKPTVLFLLNGGAVAIDAEVAHQGPAPLAIVEAFYPGLRGGEALAQGIFGQHNKFGRLPYVCPSLSAFSRSLFFFGAPDRPFLRGLRQS
jgi:beta-D-xylosidase 4